MTASSIAFRAITPRGEDRVNWLGEAQCEPLSVKVRSMAKPAPCRIERDADGAGLVQFERPEYGVAPGQAAVVYDGTRVLGGGWIEETVPAGAPPGALPGGREKLEPA